MWFPFKSRFEKLVDVKKAEERFAEEVRPELEKGDLPALIVAAFIVFAPALLLILAMLWFFSWFFGGGP